MRSTNLFIVRGYVGADAKGFDGGKVAKFSVATNRVWNDRQTGERKEACSATIWMEALRRTGWPVWRSRRGDDCRAATVTQAIFS